MAEQAWAPVHWNDSDRKKNLRCNPRKLEEDEAPLAKLSQIAGLEKAVRQNGKAAMGDRKPRFLPARCQARSQPDSYQSRVKKRGQKGQGFENELAV